MKLVIKDLVANTEIYQTDNEILDLICTKAEEYLSSFPLDDMSIDELEELDTELSLLTSIGTVEDLVVNEARNQLDEFIESKELLEEGE